ncbi:multidrug effflux MFS transporter [Fangia hongkongensis]|uniref:multidrug effflux MFS transporter n=1 Tax=Fangia hongkongensis TaxID=270495 RepID=UPI000366043D|nr:multidrug effflux MFS transporter [Fangia hongkongensis]MBK2125362.1 multidrug effflux MFS transporter [Fangia hongkongensis]
MLEMQASKSAKAIFVTMILITSMLGIFVSDIYVPSLPSIGDEFGTNASILAFSVTFYFIVFAFAQLIYGPLSERFGRRKIFLSGLAISIFGTCITLFSINFTMLIIGRTFEAIGMAAPMSLGRVILRDVIPDKTSYARFMSFMGIGTLLAPVLAPIVGAFLAHVFHWRADFIFILLLSVSCYVLCYYFLIETLLSPSKRLSAKLSIQTYIWVIKNKVFIKNTTISSCVMASIIAYLSLSAFLFQQHFGLSEINYAIVFAIGEAFIMIGMFANGMALKYISIENSQRIGVILFLFSSILMIIQAFIFPDNLVFIMIAVMIFNFSAGVIFPTSSALAIVTFKTRLGAVGSLYGCLSMLVAGLVGGAAMLVPLSAIHLIAILFLITAIISFVFLFGVKND